MCKATNGNDPPAELDFDLDVQGMCCNVLHVSCNKQVLKKLYHAGQEMILKSSLPSGPVHFSFQWPPQ